MRRRVRLPCLGHVYISRRSCSWQGLTPIHTPEQAGGCTVLKNHDGKAKAEDTTQSFRSDWVDVYCLVICIYIVRKKQKQPEPKKEPEQAKTKEQSPMMKRHTLVPVSGVVHREMK